MVFLSCRLCHADEFHHPDYLSFYPADYRRPFTSLLRKRLGVVRAQQTLLILAGCALILLVIVPNPVIPLCLALAGFGLAGPQTLTNVLFAQVADEDELRTGVRREGAFFGVNALLTKPAQSVALALSPFILETNQIHLTGSESGSDHAQPTPGRYFWHQSPGRLDSGYRHAHRGCAAVFLSAERRLPGRGEREGAGDARQKARDAPGLSGFCGTWSIEWKSNRQQNISAYVIPNSAVPIGSTGVRISVNAPGARCVKITAPKVMPGNTSPTNMPGAGLIAGMRMDWAVSSNRYPEPVYGSGSVEWAGSFLKERLFGVSGSEGNHGEDVKEYYYYLDSTPTHSYMKMLYKYPQVTYPYAQLVHGKQASWLTAIQNMSLIDALRSAFQQNLYFDVIIEYAKAGPGRYLLPDHCHQPGCRTGTPAHPPPYMGT